MNVLNPDTIHPNVIHYNQGVHWGPMYVALAEDIAGCLTYQGPGR